MDTTIRACRPTRPDWTAARLAACRNISAAPFLFVSHLSVPLRACPPDSHSHRHSPLPLPAAATMASKLMSVHIEYCQSNTHTHARECRQQRSSRSPAHPPHACLWLSLLACSLQAAGEVRWLPNLKPHARSGSSGSSG